MYAAEADGGRGVRAAVLSPATAHRSRLREGEEALVLARVGVPVAGGFDAVVYSEGGCVHARALWTHLRAGLCASAEQDFDGFAEAMINSKVEGAPPRVGDCVDVGSCFDET